MTKIKIAILGGSGYTAVELIKILLRHPQAEIVAVTSRQEEGTRGFASRIRRCSAAAICRSSRSTPRS